MQRVRIAPDFENWRRSARELLSRGVAPDQVEWEESVSPQLELLAASSEAGPTEFRVPRQFVDMRTRWAPHLIATLHPSAILRADDPEASRRSYEMLVSDLRKVRDLAGSLPPRTLRETAVRP